VLVYIVYEFDEDMGKSDVLTIYILFAINVCLGVCISSIVMAGNFTIALCIPSPLRYTLGTVGLINKVPTYVCVCTL
jgi:hypothetical protein